MAKIKCNNCGAIIPDEADFCPGCGSPKPVKEPEPEPEPVQEPISEPITPPKNLPPQKSTTKPAKKGSGVQNFFDVIFSRLLMVLVIFIGVLIAWIARVVDEFVSFGAAQNAVDILQYTFMGGVGAYLLFAGLLNLKFNHYIRLGLMIVGGVILSTTI